MQTDVTTISPTVSPAILSTVSRDWQLWIAENLLRDCTPESMVGTMVAAGVDPMAAVDAIQEAATSPTLEAARRHQQITRKLESIMLNQNKLERLSPSYSTVERRKGLTTKQLFEDYYLQCRPVVVTDMMDSWQQVKQWSPQYLKQHFGDTEVEVQYGRGNDKNYEQNKLKYRRKILLGEFVDAVLGAGPSNNLYLTANNEALKNSALSRLIGAQHWILFYGLAPRVPSRRCTTTRCACFICKWWAASAGALSRPCKRLWFTTTTKCLARSI
jgi:hypothetical protein